MFTNKSFFYTILGFTQSHQGPLNDMKGFHQILPGSYKSGKLFNITGNDKVQLKADCIHGSIANGVCELILYNFVLSSPPGHKIYKEHRIELQKKVNKSVLSHISFYIEDDDQQPVEFNGEMINFTCQLIKI